MSEYIRTDKFDTNECPNIFVKDKLIRTNVRIYIRYQYIRIFEYIRHTLLHRNDSIIKLKLKKLWLLLFTWQACCLLPFSHPELSKRPVNPRIFPPASCVTKIQPTNPPHLGSNFYYCKMQLRYTSAKIGTLICWTYT